MSASLSQTWCGSMPEPVPMTEPVDAHVHFAGATMPSVPAAPSTPPVISSPRLLSPVMARVLPVV